MSDYKNLSALIEITDNEKILFNTYRKFTFDIEQSYKSLIFGREKEYLQSVYFDNTGKGKAEFLEWVRTSSHIAV